MKPVGNALLFVGMLFTNGVLAENIESLTVTCTGCHGEQGVSQWSDMPTIAGIDEFTHSNALYEFRDEARPCVESEFRHGDTSRAPTTMCAVVADFSDEQIDALAAHYAALPFTAAGQSFDPALAEAGKAVHDKLCRRCHSDGGANPEDEASILAGQQMDYLRRTFEEYASGEREQLDKMREAMDALSDEDVDALLHYFASQQ